MKTTKLRNFAQGLMVLCLLLLSSKSFSQTAVLYNVTNFVQTAPNVFRYDVMMTNTGTTDLALRGYSWGLNTATGIANGGTVSQTYISRDASIDAAGVPAPSFSVTLQTGTCASAYHLRFTTNNASGTGAPLTVGVPLRLATVQVQTTAASFPQNFNPFTQCSTFTPVQNLVLAGKTACVATCTVTPPGTSYAINGTGNTIVTGTLQALSASMTPNPAGSSPFILNPVATCTPIVTNVNATACDTYTWATPSGNGNTYSISGNYFKATAQSANPACFDTTYLHLTINHSSSTSLTATSCDSYTWSANGVTYTASGTYTNTSLNASGCVNMATLNLTINHSSTTTSSVTACDSYTWGANGVTYTTNGTYIYTSLNASGCVNTATLQLSLYAVPIITAVIACDSYVWAVNGQTYTTSGNYTFTNINAYGCVQSSQLALTIHASTFSSQTATACDSYTWPLSGLTYTSSGTYTTTSMNSAACIATGTLTLSIQNSTYSTSNVAACNTYTWAETGQTYTQSGMYSYSTMNTQGCPWQHYLNLVVNTNSSDVQSVSACNSYTWPITGVNYTSTGVYQGTSLNAAGCDQSNQLNLTVGSSSSSTQTITANGSYTWAVNGQTYTASGTYTATSVNSVGCTQYNTLVLSMNTAAAPAVLYTINNLVQTAPGQFAFDIWLTNTGNVVLNAKSISFGLNTTANIGTLGLSYVNGSKDPIFNPISTYSPAVSLKGTAPNTYYHLRMASSQASAGTEPALQPNGTYKIGRFVVSSTQNWSAMLNPFLPPGVAPVQVSTQAGATQCVLYTLINGSSSAYSLFGIANAPTTFNLNVLNATMTPNPTGTYPFLLGAGCSNTSSTSSASACDTYTWGISGLTYTTSGVYTSIHPIGAGPCYSVDSLLLTIHHSTSGTQSETACGSYVWACNSQTYTLSGTYTCTFNNPSGCLHTQTLQVQVGQNTSSNNAITACDSYTWVSAGQTYTTSGIYVHTSLNTAGCLHTETLNLTIHNSTSGTTSATACDSYVWAGPLGDGATYTASNTTTTHTSLNAAGCVHTQTLHLVIHNSTSAITSATACDSYIWAGPLGDGATYAASNATATHTTLNAAGCVHTETLNLNLGNSTNGTTTATACDSYMWSAPLGDGGTYTVSNTTATHTSLNAAGCVHIETLNLTMHNSTSGTTNATACDSYAWNAPLGDGLSYTANNTTSTHTSLNAAGCVHTESLNLTIHNSTSGITSTAACDSYVWTMPSGDGATYTASNTTATHTTLNAAGCVHTQSLNLTLYNSTIGTTSVTVCDFYVWPAPLGDGATYTASNTTSTHTSLNAAGCIHTETLNLTMHNSTSGTTSASACDSYMWSAPLGNGATYTTNNTTATHTSLNAAGCVHTQTLDLAVHYSTATPDLHVAACDAYTWNGSIYTISGTYTHTSLNAAGCINTATLYLTINYSSTNGDATTTSCDAYIWNGTTYTTSGTYTYTSLNAAGCLNTATLYLTVNHSSANGDATETVCDTYIWNGTTYTTSGTYTYTSLNASGCINTATLYLTVNYSSTNGNASTTACDTYSWYGITYTTSGTYTYTTLNAPGCINTATLQLTINYATTNANSVSACDSYTWTITGQTWSNSGAYIHTSLNAAGCLHTDTLNLQVAYSVNTSLAVTACDTYTWSINNQTYLSSGAYAHTSLSVDGCLNTTMLNLTILYAGSDSLQTTQCSYFFWPASGQTYIQSGSYTSTSLNAQGCVSNHYLELTIQAATSSDCMVSSIRKSIPYQAAIRNGAGEEMINQNVMVRFTLFDSLPGVNPLYQEYHACTTSSLGLLSLNVGMGIPISGSYFMISWEGNPKFLKVEVDTTNTGSMYVDLGTQQLASVPYAHYAESSGNGLQKGISEGEMMYWDGAAWVTIPPGAQGQTLTFCNGKPHWGPCP